MFLLNFSLFVFSKKSIFWVLEKPKDSFICSYFMYFDFVHWNLEIKIFILIFEVESGAGRDGVDYLVSQDPLRLAKVPEFWLVI